MKTGEHNKVTLDSLMNSRPGKRVAVIDSSKKDESGTGAEQVQEQAGRRLDISEVRKTLSEKEGRAYWRSLEEISESEEFSDLMSREFPHMAGGFEGVDRRTFIKLMGASMAMAGLTACTRQPSERIVPYVRPPEKLLPGKPVYFASVMPLGGYAHGVLARSDMGRPIKIEGNPDHPSSLGGTDAITQASILGLYDPDRSQYVKHRGRISTWNAFLSNLNEQLSEQQGKGGAGLRILTETITSLTMKRQLERILERYPNAKWHQYDPVCRDNVREGARLAFNKYVDTVYRFDQADIVVSLDSDFLQWGPGHTRYARDFASRREVSEDKSDMNRLYVVECVPSLTGSNADHRLAVKADEVEEIARALAEELGVDADARRSSVADVNRIWIESVARDLRRNRGSCLVVAGEHQPPEVHALAHAMNDALDSSGHTVVHVEPVEARPENHAESLADLAEDMRLGWVDMLIMVDVNPIYNAPVDLEFADRLESVPFRVHMGSYDDETANLSHWHVPLSHFLEGWSDARAYDGTASIVQPLIEPLYQSRSQHELMAALLGESGVSDHDLVREFWEEKGMAGDFDAAWRKALHDGIIEGTAANPVSVTARKDIPRSADGNKDGLEIVFNRDDGVMDGRFANNGWLQEMPANISKLTWDNAVLMSPSTAEEIGVANEDVVEIRHEGRTVKGPVWVTPGHADGSVSVQLGFGRLRAGQVGNGVGFNAYGIRTSGKPWFDGGVSVEKTGERYQMATTQHHHRMEGRHLVRVGTLDRFKETPDFAQRMKPEPAQDESMFPPYDYSTGYSWGMTINLNTCIGCNACLVACQSENNIPVVGKKEVRIGREMHWIRIDRYYEGELDEPDTHFQPVPCMHCEKAPCEPVCPVGATVHSSEGLNEMVYNRCVGTRYCSNNCPYKVRRFNFYQYADEKTPSLKLLRNPDVTVRVRGVMEKCTYCVQRINRTRVDAELENREIRDGELKTACQQACPTRAIAFGNLNDPDSEVVKMKAQPLNYALLGDINVRPRTTYLAKVKNPNPELLQYKNE